VYQYRKNAKLQNLLNLLPNQYKTISNKITNSISSFLKLEIEFFVEEGLRWNGSLLKQMGKKRNLWKGAEGSG